MYREGWLINPQRLRSSVIPKCVVAWNALARQGALPAVRFLVMHNCPVLERKMEAPLDSKFEGAPSRAPNERQEVGPDKESTRDFKISRDVTLLRTPYGGHPASPPQTGTARPDGTTGGPPSASDYRPAKFRPPLTPQQIAHPSNYYEQYWAALSAYDEDLVRVAQVRFSKDAQRLAWLQKAQQQRDANNINRTKSLIYPVR
jgi:hypothetical protein